MGRRNHAGPHKYMRMNIGNKKKKKQYIVFKCQLDGCSSFKKADLAVGDMSICWRCDAPFKINKAHLMMRKPICINCKGGAKKGAKPVEVRKENVDKLLGFDINDPLDRIFFDLEAKSATNK